ncbi:MAG TPA: hypothetical protein VKV16_00755 [Solirubrobacteraceae bacterium]|nr:hypothetical protein [Solirubrobacteraceae bacterium]
MHRRETLIDGYVRELAHELRVARWRRRRIVAEVRSHLLEAARAERAAGLDAPAAAQRALARFGAAGEAAREFNALPSARRLTLRRALAPCLVAVALTCTASASVGAFQPGAPHASRDIRAGGAAPRTSARATAGAAGAAAARAAHARSRTAGASAPSRARPNTSERSVERERATAR